MKTEPQDSSKTRSQAEGMACSRPSVVSLLLSLLMAHNERVLVVLSTTEGSSTIIMKFHPFMKFTDLERNAIMSGLATHVSVYFK